MSFTVLQSSLHSLILAQQRAAIIKPERAQGDTVTLHSQHKHSWQTNHSRSLSQSSLVRPAIINTGINTSY